MYTGHDSYRENCEETRRPGGLLWDGFVKQVHFMSGVKIEEVIDGESGESTGNGDRDKWRNEFN